MRLPFDADQATFDAWKAHHTRRAADPADDFMWIDLNDAVMVFIAGRSLASKHPELVDRFIEHGPEAVERASKDLGMFMGIAYLAQKVGLDGEEGEQAMSDLMR